MALLDVKDYIQTKEQMLKDYEDKNAWAKKMLVNIAKAGFFLLTEQLQSIIRISGTYKVRRTQHETDRDFDAVVRPPVTYGDRRVGRICISLD